MARYQIGEAGGRLGVSRSTLIRWEHVKRIPRARRDIAGRRYYSEADLKVLEEAVLEHGRPRRKHD